MTSPGRLILSLVSVTNAIGGFIADWNHTHVFNSAWPPHAKFHNGQTLSTGVLLGVASLYYLYRPHPTNIIENKRQDLGFVVLLTSLNWIAQVSAAFYPGSLPIDPEFGEGFPQAYIAALLLSMVGVGFWLEEKVLSLEEKKRQVSVHEKISNRSGAGRN